MLVWLAIDAFGANLHLIKGARYVYVMPTLHSLAENRHVNAGQCWSAAVLAVVLATLAFDQANDFCFPADKSMRK